ncbi:acylneuraminate cytidylyltransferase family protein [Desulfovibrio desulfuricans]|uniref:acylneuraminate cytidylyltransferase family protein n=1 Tax=Desulfovibrio desulfuricans TaxID=876 RepID=UPI003983DB63
MHYRKGKIMATPTVTALVPIKGASERVPGKNLRSFCGQPLLCKVLEMMQQCLCVEKIIVNTDSDIVANLSSQWSKVVIHERPAALCGHHIPMNSIIAHDIGLLGDGHYLQTHVTNPLLRKETVVDAVSRYFGSLTNHDSLFSVREMQTRFWRADGTPMNHDPSRLMNTQDLEPIYEENSCVYIFSSRSFQQAGNNRIGQHPLLFPIAQSESFDIDTEDDFHIAELAWKAFRESAA